MLASIEASRQSELFAGQSELFASQFGQFDSKLNTLKELLAKSSQSTFTPQEVHGDVVPVRVIVPKSSVEQAYTVMVPVERTRTTTYTVDLNHRSPTETVEAVPETGVANRTPDEEAKGVPEVETRDGTKMVPVQKFPAGDAPPPKT